jgi:hypothetical protein
MARLGDPILPISPESAYDAQLNRKLLDFFRVLVNKVNGLASGVFTHSADNALPSIPTSGTYARDDFVPKSSRVEAGVATQKYVVLGWLRLTGGSAHVANVDWVEVRILTGN